MDRSWINANRISDVCEKGVEDLLEFAKRNGTTINGRYYFPCVNLKRLDIELIREHALLMVS